MAVALVVDHMMSGWAAVDLVVDRRLSIGLIIVIDIWTGGWRFAADHGPTPWGEGRIYRVLRPDESSVRAP